MEHRKKATLIVVMFISIAFLNLSTDASLNKSYPLSSFFVNSSPIIILNDSNFTDYGFTGSGTSNDPIIIENLNITVGEEMGIYITNTTKHFVIQNCYIQDTNYGIYVNTTKTSTPTILSNVCFNNSQRSIYVVDTHYSTVINNTCSFSKKYSIHVRNGTGCVIQSNYCYSNSWVGIFIDKSNSSYIQNNICTENSRGGIVLDYCSFSLVSNNTCNSNSFHGGIRLLQCYFSEILNNTCHYNYQYNLDIRRSNSSTVYGNECKGNSYGMLVDSGGQVSILSNKVIDCANGIWVRDAEYSTIQENILTDCSISINEESAEELLTYTLCSNYINGKLFGFITEQKRITISDSHYGQLILVKCSKIKIKNQELSSTTIGLELIECNEISISNSIFNNNRDTGILLKNSEEIQMTNNSFELNGNYGIKLESSSLSKITYNTFNENTRWGVVLDSNSDDNVIHHNSFVSNNRLYGTSQVKDDGNGNIWYDLETEEGNFYDDHLGKGNYSIEGDAGSFDLYPLAEPPIYIPPNYFGYFAFLSLLILIPVCVFVIKIRRKRIL